MMAQNYLFLDLPKGHIGLLCIVLCKYFKVYEMKALKFEQQIIKNLTAVKNADKHLGLHKTILHLH